MSIDSLPDDLLVEISSGVGASSLSDIRNLRLVSSSFRKFCDDRYVLSRLSLQEIPLFPWFENPVRFSNFFKRCRRFGNPEAFYRKGFINFFIDNCNRKHKGLGFLSKAAEKGNREAKYVYGMILICRRGKLKQKGFEILSSLTKPVMSKTMEELEKLRHKIRDNVWWRGRPVMKQLKRSYVRKKCECNGETRKFLLNNCAWHQWGADNDMKTSSACEICLWHHEVELFFDRIE
ncbi:putative F-box protein [Cardamine amara subsp. amara]|uniref:F-box protein n=1 Tax=Cardamine amara subsp. amara TaxID=228776 RepID=A0ABD1BBX5_CARAN